MSDIIETIRISEKGKQQLSRLKRSTGISNWNTLCRWALCTSLAEPSVPPKEEIPADSNVEMTWKTFAGEHAEIYLAIIRQRLIEDDLSNDELGEWFRIHLHRGISFMSNSYKDHTSILDKAIA
ncbi:DNA sulfur modification protein DndE [Halieaceae bacterium]|nr:DNA sulfur modification protein DndE [Halieaceae bacterium]